MSRQSCWPVFIWADAGGFVSAPHIMIVAGSLGDLLGADLIEASCPVSRCRLFWCGRAGHDTRGFHLFSICRRFSLRGSAPFWRICGGFRSGRLTAAHACTTRPDVVVLIDSPEFNYRVAARIKKRHPDIRVICYVAPSVWAWRRGRARKMARHFDAVLSLFPRAYFRAGRANCHFVGHPIVDRFRVTRPLPIFKQYNTPAEANFVHFARQPHGEIANWRLYSNRPLCASPAKMRICPW